MQNPFDEVNGLPDDEPIFEPEQEEDGDLEVEGEDDEEDDLEVEPEQDMLAALLAGARSRMAGVKAQNRANMGKSLPGDNVILMRATWHPCARVAILIHTVCAGCGVPCDAFAGWFVEFSHVTDTHARRLIAGIAPEHSLLPARRELHQHAPTPHCAACIDTYLSSQLQQSAHKGAA